MGRGRGGERRRRLGKGVRWERRKKMGKKGEEGGVR